MILWGLVKCSLVKKSQYWFNWLLSDLSAQFTLVFHVIFQTAKQKVPHFVFH